MAPRSWKRLTGMPTVLFGTITNVLPPKSVPSRLTPSQFRARKPFGCGEGVAPLLAPPIAASKASCALSGPPLELLPPAPEKVVGAPGTTSRQTHRGASSTPAVELDRLGL